MSFEMSRRQYAALYGPTTGDAVRLADTDLFLEVEKDLTSHGDETVFGGGKVIRDGMGHDGNTVRDGAPGDLAVADTVITNVIVLDHTGIYKADVGLRDGRILAIGKAGNPNIMDGVDVVIGPRPRPWPVRAASSPPGAWTPTSTSSAPTSSLPP